MNYQTEIQKCIEYIETHIKDDISVEQLAQNFGYSVFHFSRVFSLCQGISIMEYVRKRRLSLSALDLFHGKKIIDIALDYGFETPNGYTKAFRKVYGYNPTQYVARMIGYDNINLTTKIGGYIMNPTIVKKSAFKVAGYGIKTNIIGSSYTKDIASFWSNFEGENLESKLYDILNPPKHGEFGLCVPCSDDGTITYLLGVCVDNFTEVQGDMLTKEVPEAEYAVFTTPPIDTTQDHEQKNFANMIKTTWKYIFEEWFENSDYMYDEEKLDFEFYDERCHFRADTVMEIYVPVKKKS